VKRSDIDESIWVVIYLCMEAMLGISLYSYPYLNKQKCFVFLIIAMSSLQQNWRRVQNRFCLEARGEGGGERGYGSVGRNDPNNVCTYEYMNKEKEKKLSRNS
jgi:hypothetical protein